MAMENFAERYYSLAEEFERRFSNPILTDRTSYKARYLEVATNGIVSFFENIEREQPSATEALVSQGVRMLGLVNIRSLGGNNTYRGSIYAALEPDSLPIQVETVAHELCHVIIAHSEARNQLKQERELYLKYLKEVRKLSGTWFNPLLITEEAWCEDFIGIWLDQYGYRDSCTKLVSELRQDYYKSELGHHMNLLDRA